MRRRLFAIAGFLLLWGLQGPVAAASGDQRALLLLHGQDEAPPPVSGCQPWRSGPVAGTSGPLDLGAPQRFTLLACAAAVLADPERRAALGGQRALRAVEGRVALSAGGEPDAAALRRRAYVLKISHYNNSDLDGRDRDLAEINALAAARTDAWQTEGFVAVERALGMATPDEVVLIFYDDPAQGQRFRDKNPDILAEIGAFNRRHLIDFTYLSAGHD